MEMILFIRAKIIRKANATPLTLPLISFQNIPDYLASWYFLPNLKLLHEK
jgi:hypothetical protein